MITELIKGSPNILGQIYKDLAQPSVRAVGSALGTVFEFSTSFLLPVKLLNEKIKLIFTKNLNDYKDKLEKVSEEKICEVHPQIGIPIIEKLTYTTNAEIADLFTTLLVNASNIDMGYTAHPSFINIIERLTPDEARIIKYLKDKSDILYCDFRALTGKNNGYVDVAQYLTLVPFEVELQYPDNINAYFANLVSLGILIDMNGTHKLDQKVYDQIKDKYEFEEYKLNIDTKYFIGFTTNDSFFKVTDFGKLFIAACTES